MAVARQVSLNPAEVEVPGARYVHYRLLATTDGQVQLLDRRGQVVRLLVDATATRTAPTQAVAEGTNPSTGEAETWTARKSAGCGCKARNQHVVGRPTP
jgi:hypothetical protein